ncbi:hypothetical protein [Pseudomaricurvus sp.]|uniref:hypothetical protein n=1 Tax=Pseudomaricurvus sp. TaxID=2004510 RepID=UPI003F6CA3F4
MTQTDQPLFDVIFRGDIAPGHQLPEVKAKMAKLFKADLAKIDALFVGGAVPLKKNLDRATAEKYQAVLKSAGADVQLAEAGKVGQNKTAKKKAVPQKKVVQGEIAPEAPRAVSAEQPMTMAQRLAAQEAEREKQEAEREKQAATAPESDSTQRETETEAGESKGTAQKDTSGFSLAPVGAELLEGVEKEALPDVVVDISQITLRPQEGDLVDDSERFVVEPVDVRVEDYGLSELGDDLLNDDERQSLPLVEVDVPEVDLSPVGSDLGQLKGAEPPPPPDTSGLSIKTD